MTAYLTTTTKDIKQAELAQKSNKQMVLRNIELDEALLTIDLTLIDFLRKLDLADKMELIASAEIATARSLIKKAKNHIHNKEQ